MANHQRAIVNLLATFVTGGTLCMGTASGDTLEVCPTCTYTTLSDALTAANDGDVINIAPGTYYGGLQIGGKKITIQGAGGVEDADAIDPTVATIISPDPSGQRSTLILCNGGEDNSTVFRNLTFYQAGWTPNPEEGDLLANGSAIRCLGGSSPTIENCIFQDNQSFRGGGALYIVGGGSPVITDCLFFKNKLDGDDPVFAEGLGFVVNTAASAVHISGGSSTFSDCRFVENGCFDHPGTEAYGGAAYINVPNGVHFDQCEFQFNRAGSGGAVWVDGDSLDDPYDSVRFTGCTFTQNEAFNGAFCVPDPTTTDPCAETTNFPKLGGMGGALGSYVAQMDIENCIFNSNIAGCLECVVGTGSGSSLGFGGGAVACQYLAPTISGSVFQYNKYILADGEQRPETGSAIYLDQIDCEIAKASIKNTKLCGNTPAAQQVDGFCGSQTGSTTYTITGGCLEVSCIDCLGNNGVGSGNCPADTNGDGAVDGEDLAIVLGAWGLPCDE